MRIIKKLTERDDCGGERHVASAYRDPSLFLRSYLSEVSNKNPNLGYSLSRISEIPDNERYIAALPQSPVCLIEGYSDQLNANELSRFLKARGIQNPELHAIDLMNIPGLYESLGISFPELNFVQANAANLIGIFESGKFNLVVQDFLLNCAPVVLHDYILSELHRVMADDGIALLSFTALPSEAAVLEDVYSGGIERSPADWDLKAYSVEDIDAVHDSALRGKRFYCGRTQSVVFVTPETGNFEFYRPYEHFSLAFQRAGLRIIERVSSKGVDAHSQMCCRHHCIVKRDDV
ncbi:MAG: hypothetical protein ACSHYA_13370 [Opitutaceae bacterium]